MRALYLFFAIFSLSACVSGRAHVEWQSERLLRVAASGTAFNSNEGVRDATLERASEEVRAAGYTHFALVNEDNATRRNTVKTSDGYATTTGSFTAQGYGTNAYGTTSSTTHYTPPTYSTVDLHSTTARFYALDSAEVERFRQEYPLVPVYSVSQFSK